MTPQHVFETVCKLLGTFVDALPSDRITPATSIVHDLGMTSLKMVDMTLALEDAFQIEEFPIQDWIDGEAQKGEGGFAVQSLVDECVRLINGG